MAQMPQKKREDEELTEPNVLPVMNIMFLMIPALLLAMEIAKMAAISVSTPHTTASRKNTPVEQPPEDQRLDFKVFIREDGFQISTAQQRESIALAKPGAPMADYERYDYVALEAKAKELKQKFAAESVVTLTAENDVSMQVLTMAMDAVRGSDCKTLTVKEGESMPEECLFFQPVVEAGAG
jgi:biopolymer transport protein ExbD